MYGVVGGFFIGVGFMMIAQNIDTIVEKIVRAVSLSKEPRHRAAGPSETGGSGAARMG